MRHTRAAPADPPPEPHLLGEPQPFPGEVFKDLLRLGIVVYRARNAQQNGGPGAVVLSLAAHEWSTKQHSGSFYEPASNAISASRPCLVS